MRGGFRESKAGGVLVIGGPRPAGVLEGSGVDEGGKGMGNVG